MAPTVGGSLFAWSLTANIGFPLDINLVFILFGFVFLMANILTVYIPERLNRQHSK